MGKKTVGKIATDLMQKDPATRDPVELQREMHKDYEANIMECVERGKKDLIGNFYIVVETKKERLLQNVLRNYFFYRVTCPTPNTDQTVYKYYSSNERIELLWVVPSKDTCQLFTQNALQIVPEEKELLNYVLSYSDGSLLRLAKTLNNEKDDSSLLAN